MKTIYLKISPLVSLLAFGVVGCANDAKSPFTYYPTTNPSLAEGKAEKKVDLVPEIKIIETTDVQEGAQEKTEVLPSPSPSPTVVGNCGTSGNAGTTEYPIVPRFTGAYGLDPGKYKACPVNQSKTSIEVHGQLPQGFSEQDEEVCIFPAIYIDSFQTGYGSQPRVIWFPDSRGVPYSQCFSMKNVGPSGIIATFDGATYNNQPYNYLFIVRSMPRSYAPSRDQMTQCLYYENQSYCPTYSEGRFR